SILFLPATASSSIYTLSLHDALPICLRAIHQQSVVILALADNSLISRYGSAVSVRFENALRRSLVDFVPQRQRAVAMLNHKVLRSEEHTSELQSRENLVCRLLLEKKK